MSEGVRYGAGTTFGMRCWDGARTAIGMQPGLTVLLCGLALCAHAAPLAAQDTHQDPVPSAASEEQTEGGGAETDKRDAKAGDAQESPSPTSSEPPSSATSNDADSESPAQSSPGQRAFARGVELSRQERWEAAAEAFEASLEAADRPATRYNLARAYAAFERPLEVARQALAFLDEPRSPHRAEARAELETLLATALRSLAVLELTVKPKDAEVRVDGEPLDVVDETGRAYLRAGTHVLQVRAPEHLPFESTRLLPSGQVTTVAVALASKPKAAETIVKTRPVRWRRPLALALATTGAAVWAAGAGTYAAAEARQGEVAGLEPQARGGLPEALRYRKLRDAAGPLSLVGGTLAAGAAMVSERAPRRGWGWAMLGTGTALAAAALAVAIPQPEAVGQWNTRAPTRALGFVLLGAALPTLGLGVRWLWQPEDASLAISPTGIHGSF